MNFFTDAVINLDIDRTLHINSEVISDNPVVKAIQRFQNHPNIVKIQEIENTKNTFHFHFISETNIRDTIIEIDSSKAYQRDNIPPKLLKENIDICAVVLFPHLNK